MLSRTFCRKSPEKPKKLVFFPFFCIWGSVCPIEWGSTPMATDYFCYVKKLYYRRINGRIYWIV